METDTKAVLSADDWFAKDKRRNRWLALHDDAPLFGLVPSEQAELDRLDSEFGEYSKDSPNAQ